MEVDSYIISNKIKFTGMNNFYFTYFTFRANNVIFAKCNIFLGMH